MQLAEKPRRSGTEVNRHGTPAARMRSINARE